jgi:hypothetical protein
MVEIGAPLSALALAAGSARSSQDQKPTNLPSDGEKKAKTKRNSPMPANIFAVLFFSLSSSVVLSATNMDPHKQITPKTAAGSPMKTNVIMPSPCAMTKGIFIFAER